MVEGEPARNCKHSRHSRVGGGGETESADLWPGCGISGPPPPPVKLAPPSVGAGQSSSGPEVAHEIGGVGARVEIYVDNEQPQKTKPPPKLRTTQRVFKMEKEHVVSRSFCRPVRRKPGRSPHPLQESSPVAAGGVSASGREEGRADGRAQPPPSPRRRPAQSLPSGLAWAM